MQIKYKSFAIVLAIIMIISLIPTSVFAIELTYTPSTAYATSSYYSSLKSVVLTGNQRTDLVNVARSQVNYREGSCDADLSGWNDGSHTHNNYCEYNYWYWNGNHNGGSDYPWCAVFVSWCARQARIPTSILKSSSRAGCNSSNFNISYYSGSNYTPKPGDLFFTSSWSHVGIVSGVNGDSFYTIEGNTNSNGSSSGIGVFELTRKGLSNYYFGVPNYSNDTPPAVINPPSQCWISIDKGNNGQYVTGENVKLTYGATNVSSYYIEIYKDGAIFDSFNTSYGETTKSFSGTGHYSAVMTAINTAGNAQSGWIGWDVVQPTPPSSFSVWTDKSSANVNENIIIYHWAENVSYYNVKIYRYDALVYDQNAYTSQSTVSFSATGEYRADVTAINDHSSVSSTVGFSITGSNPNAPQGLSVWTDKTSANANENLTVYHWAENARYYKVKIYRYADLVYDQTEYTSQTTVSYGAAGEYRADIIAINDDGIATASVGFNVQGSSNQDPQGFSVWTDKAVVTKGNYLTIYHWAENARYYRVRIFKDDELAYDTYEYTSQTNIAYDDCGRYIAKITAVNGYGTAEKEVEFTVKLPTYSITYNYGNGSENTVKYYDIQETATISEEIPLRTGYKFIGWATQQDATQAEYNPGDAYIDFQDLVLFAVWKVKPSTNTNVTKKPSYTLFNVSVSNAEQGNVIIVACYKNGKAVDIQIEEYEGEDLLIATAESYDQAKIMLWESINSMSPLCTVETKE